MIKLDGMFRNLAIVSLLVIFVNQIDQNLLLFNDLRNLFH